MRNLTRECFSEETFYTCPEHTSFIVTVKKMFFSLQLLEEDPYAAEMKQAAEEQDDGEHLA